MTKPTAASPGFDHLGAPFRDELPATASGGRGTMFYEWEDYTLMLQDVVERIATEERDAQEAFCCELIRYTGWAWPEHLIRDLANAVGRSWR
jgi:hypothetical protein